MSFTVGLDFGTHQTKICIENATNPAQKTYEFLEFIDLNGTGSVLFPSIVQINKDDTISYGFIDKSECKINTKKSTHKPQLELPLEPTIALPKKPIKQRYPEKPILQKGKTHLSWKEQLMKITQGNYQRNRKNHRILIEEWKRECQIIDQNFITRLEEWEGRINSLKLQHENRHKEWVSQCINLQKTYNSSLKKWQDENVEKLQFHYFKQATFVGSKNWKHHISADIISVWYLTYILFLLQDKLGENFYVQMGIPSGIETRFINEQKKKAFSLLISAYKLVDLYKSKEEFLKEKYTDLLSQTKIVLNYSNDDLNFYGLNILPEAFAGLSSITQQGRIESGMSLLVDIGGGTTDIAFFTIQNKYPNIHAVLSLSKGLNHIFEEYLREHNNLAIAEIQALFLKEDGSKLLFHSSIDAYQKLLHKEVCKMLEQIKKSFINRQAFHNIPTSKLFDALKNRPLIFCGGGSVYSNMRRPLLNFDDLKIINKNMLNIPTVINKSIDNQLFTILATAYGLCIPIEHEIKLTPIEQVFNHLDSTESNSWETKYEHGLSDF